MNADLLDTAYYGDTKHVMSLLDKGADANTKDEYDCMPPALGGA